MTDNVDHPSHYTEGDIECIDAIAAALGEGMPAYCVGNVVKYVWRYKSKNGIEDLKKAQWYLNRVIADLENLEQNSNKGKPKPEYKNAIKINPDLLERMLDVCSKEHEEGIHENREENTYPIATLCGSTRFKDDFLKETEALTQTGHIVLSVGVFGHADGIKLLDSEKEMLDKMHRKKIDLADFIYVINRDGYIGDSTQQEIQYAISLGKPVLFMEE